MSNVILQSEGGCRENRPNEERKPSSPFILIKDAYPIPCWESLQLREQMGPTTCWANDGLQVECSHFKPGCNLLETSVGNTISAPMLQVRQLKYREVMDLPRLRIHRLLCAQERPCEDIPLCCPSGWATASSRLHSTYGLHCSGLFPCPRLSTLSGAY